MFVALNRICLSALGAETVAITVGGSARSIRALVDERPVEVDLADGSAAIAVQVQMSGQSSDMVGVKEGDAVRLRGRDFRAVAVLPDGTGWTVVTLRAISL